jgi:hypothetical protein
VKRGGNVASSNAEESVICDEEEHPAPIMSAVNRKRDRPEYRFILNDK